MRNPIFRKELMLHRKSPYISVMILTCNAMLWIYAVFNLLNMEQNISEFGYIDNLSFIALFRSIALVEFLMISVSVPITSALSITGDRERKTLDLVLTSLVTPKEVIFGKMLNSMYVIGLVLFSTLPVLSICFMYGGMMAVDFWSVFILFIVTGFLFSAIGIYASSRVKDSLGAILTTFALIVMLYVIIIWVFIANSSGKEQVFKGVVLFVYNPFYTLLMYVNSIGGARIYGELTRFVGSFSKHMIFNPFFFFGQVLQILTGVVFLLLSVRELKSK